MSWFVPAFDLWWQVTLAGLVLTAAAALAVLLTGQPARKIRIIQLALVGLLVLPALVLLPGYPRAASWPTVGDIEPVAHQSHSLPAKPRDIAPQHADTASTSAAPKPPALPEGTLPAPLPDSTTPAAEPPLARASRTPTALNDAPQPPKTRATTPIPSARAARDFTTNPARAAPSAVAAPREPAGFTLPALPDYHLLVISAYFAGVALFALWWLIGRIALWRLLRTAMPAEPEVRTLFEEVAASSDRGPSAARVRLLVSSRAAQPCAFGWLRPTIVLPERVVKELTPDQLRLALSHEWSHVARGDIRTWMLAGLVRLVHYHQPLVWLLRRELRVSQDYLADAAAAGAATPEDYAELLTALSQMLRPTPLSPGLGIAPRRSDLYRRVVMLVDPSRPLERTIPRRWNLAAVMLGVALVAGVATLRAEPEGGQSVSADAPEASADTSAEEPTQPNTNRTRDSNMVRIRLELEIEEIQEKVAQLEKAREQLTKQAEKQLLVKEREKIDKQLQQVNLLCHYHGQHLQNCLRLLDEHVNAGGDPPTSPYKASAASTSRPEATTKPPASNRDLGALAVQLVETREKLEGLLLRRKNLQRQIDREETAEKKEILSQHLKAIDDATAEESQKLVKIERQFEQSRREDYARTLAAVAGWEQSGEKRRMLESLWEELDELLKARDEMFKQAAQQTNSKDRRPFEANIERLDATRVQIAQRIDELLNPVASRSVAATTEQEERLGIQLEPQHLAEMIFQNDPLIAELKRTLAKKELVLAQVRSSGATPEALKAAHHEVLQIEELIEELKSDRMPALLELLGSGNTQASPRTAGSQPFSGRIRPGDILGIEIAGGIPDTKSPATRTVEPDGNVVLGAVYGSASRVNVGGKTLIEAGQAITEQLRDVLRNPQVVVTYEGHDDGVIAEGAPAAAAISQPAPANAEPVVLQPLDTIEVIVPLSRTRAYLSDSFDKPVEIFAGKNPPVSGTYVIEPDGRVALPEAGGRVKLGGLNETEASKRLREHLSAHLFPRLALPSVTVLRRGRAVFPEGKQPTADYRIAPGDTVLASTYLPLNAMVIDAQGRFPLDSWNGKPVEKISVAGLTLEEAQAALRKAFLWKAFPVSNVAGTETDRTAPWILTLGGWREEADPEVIDLIEGTDATQLLRMQQEMEELKSMIQRLQAK